jgi:hypothetical protein
MALAGTASPAAAVAPVIADEDPPSFSETEDGKHTATFGLANATDDELLLLRTEDPDDEGCSLSFGGARLQPGEHATAAVTAASTCDTSDGISFELLTRPALPEPVELTAAAPDPEEEPDWAALDRFAWAAIAALLVVLIATVRWYMAADDDAFGFLAPLKQLDAAWSFTDSWVTNLTFATAVVTGLFGASGILEAVLGDAAKNSIALATVGSAIAAAFVAMGQVFVLATKKTAKKGYEDGGRMTVIGMLGGAALTLTGAFGEIFVLAEAGSNLDLAGREDAIELLALMATGLLVWYGIRGLHLILETGTNPPKPEIGDIEIMGVRPVDRGITEAPPPRPAAML